MHSKNIQPYLKVRNLTKKFGKFTALKDISLDILENEFVCFLGPSGCGKTTLLRAIAGLDIQTYGSISQGGRDISLLPPSERDFGIVFQSYALFPNLTVTRNVAVGLENQSILASKVQQRVDELLKLVDLMDQKDKYPAQLSGGQQQRVAIARAIAMKPKLILADEPTGNLDSENSQMIADILFRYIKEEKSSLIMVTHDPKLANKAKRKIKIKDGKIV